MALNSLRQICIGILLIIWTVNLCGCQEISEYKSTSERIPENQLEEEIITTSYETTEVYQGDFTVDYQTEACVTYTLSRNLYWSNSQDTYGELLVSNGDIVKKGDVLATFQSSQDDEIEVAEASLAVQEAEASLSQIMQTYESLISAKERSLDTLKGEEYEKASLELEKIDYEYRQRIVDGEYRLAQLQARLNEIMDEHEQKQLLAPYDGKITMVSRAFKPGELVDVNITILQICDLNSRVLAFKNNSFANEIKYLSEVTLTDPYTMETYTGTIVSCPQVTGSAGSDIIVKVNEELPEDKDDVDFKVNGTILSQENVILVESDAIRKEGQRTCAYILSDNNAKYKVEVTIGKEYDGVTWILEGLLPGQIVTVE